MKKILILLIIAASSMSAQVKLNKFKYVIVPEKLDAFNKPDKYQTSSLIKFLFKKNGYKVFLSGDELPEELANNRCLASYVGLIDKSNMFSTKLNLELKDCANTQLYTFQQGKSKFKDYKKSYHEAIRNSFKSLKNFKHNYKTKTIVKEATITKATPEKIVPVVKEEQKVTSTVKNSTVKNTNATTLYAQPNSNGYQLVNTKPEIVFQVLKTQYPSLYIIKDKNGILIKKENGFWEAQYYNNDKLITKSYQLKF